jgi:hypothetical protein
MDTFKDKITFDRMEAKGTALKVVAPPTHRDGSQT